MTVIRNAATFNGVPQNGGIRRTSSSANANGVPGLNHGG